jgi:hypothetical protein
MRKPAVEMDGGVQDDRLAQVFRVLPAEGDDI